jgi:hypothetical protein
MQLTITVNAPVTLVQDPIKLFAVQLLFLLMQTLLLVATGQVALAHLLRIEILPMQLILLP